MGIFYRKKNWYIDYYAQGKRIKKLIGPNRTLALNVLRKKKVEIAENRHLDVKKELKIKFEDFAHEYLELHSKPNNKSWQKSDLHNVNCLKKFFSGLYLYEITSEMVDRFKAERIKKVSPARVNRVLSCLKSMFNRAIEWDKVEENPVVKVKMLRVKNNRLRYLEKEEIFKLLVNCNERLKPIVIVAINTGMRRGEILGLKWHDIDFRRSIIYLLNTKNDERREIPFNNATKTALISVRRQSESPYIFCNKYGKSYISLRTSFFTALKKSGILNFRFHDLRHTFASHLVTLGIDLNTVRELLGHKSLEMTLRYAHLSPDHKRRAVDKLESEIVPIRAPKEKTDSTLEDIESLTVSNSIA